MPAAVPLESFGLDDAVRFAVSLRAFKNVTADGRIVMDRADRLADPRRIEELLAAADEPRCPALRMASIFISPESGNSRLRVAPPAGVDLAALPSLAEADHAHHLTRAAAESGRLGVLDEAWRPIVTREHHHPLDVDRDTNGAGLVYFANFVAFMDTAERLALADVGELPGAAARSLRHRRIAYYGNAGVEDTLSCARPSCATPRAPTVWAFASRSSGARTAASSVCPRRARRFRSDRVGGGASAAHRALPRYGRRLLFAAVWLLLFDQLVPPLLRQLERRRYEEGREVFRFENSDLFALGPLVAYLSDNPRGERPRVLFFGNSVVFGYGLTAAEALPARYQDQRPDVRVFSVAVNGFELPSNFLVARAAIDSVDTMMVLVTGGAAHPRLPELVPVAEEDLRAFGLEGPGPEQRLRRGAGVWRLYAHRHRLQAALFGASTRQFLYLHKGELARRALGGWREPRPPAAPGPPPDGEVTLRAPHAGREPSAARRRALRAAYPLPWRFAELARAHGKRLVLLQLGASGGGVVAADVPDFNAAFAPSAEVVLLGIDPSLTLDGQHLSAAGAVALAGALARHERAVETRR